MQVFSKCNTIECLSVHDIMINFRSKLIEQFNNENILIMK